MGNDEPFVCDTLTVETEGPTAVITINRPHLLNALDEKFLKELELSLDRFSEDPSVWILVITGAGPKAFAAGADITSMEPMNPAEAKEFSRLGHRVFAKLEEFPGVTIAAVNGYALGGGNELALCCDIRIGSENAKFGQPEVGLGIIPGWGGTQRLIRTVGRANALYLLLTGRVIDAREAHRIGLLHLVVPEGQVLARAKEIAGEISKKSPFAVKQAKLAILRGKELPLAEGMKLEEELFGQCFSHPDQKEGMRAFIEKRPARFRG